VIERRCVEDSRLQGDRLPADAGSRNDRAVSCAPRDSAAPGKINVTDLDSRNVKTPRSYTQGYNVQAAVNEHQIVLAAEITLTSPDFGQLEPMIKATQRELQQIGVNEVPGVAVADSGYWHEDQIDNVVSNGSPTDFSCSSNSAVSAVFTDALAFMTKHSCRGLPTSASRRTRDTGPYSVRPATSTNTEPHDASKHHATQPPKRPEADPYRVAMRKSGTSLLSCITPGRPTDVI
jgi:hypothetical protein